MTEEIWPRESTRLPERDSRKALASALILLAATSTVGASPADALRACAARANPNAAGLETLQRQCPELEPALRELGLSDSLDPASRSRLSAASLKGLAALTARYQTAQITDAPDASRVRTVVDALARERAPTPRSWWDAFKAWLRSLLDSDKGRSLSWLDRWLERFSISNGVLTGIIYGLLLIFVVGAIWIVVRELRAAGVLDGRRRSGPAHAAPGAARSAELTLTLAALDSAPLIEQPGILLRLLVQELAIRRRLQGDRPLTHRELADRAILDDATQRERFSGVAKLAERLLYGPRQPSAERIDDIVADGRALVSEIQRSGVRP